MNQHKYRLLKDIVSMDLTAKAGEIGVQNWNQESYDEAYKVWFDNGRYFFYLSKIRQYPDWFELITEKERICVTEMVAQDLYALIKSAGGGDNYLHLKFNSPITSTQMPLIREAIEKILNDE